MAENIFDVAEKYPGFNVKDRRAAFKHPISTVVNTNSDRYELVEYFYKLPKGNGDIQNAAESTRMIANSNFEILGNSSDNADVTYSTTVAGIECQTDGGSGDSIIILPHLDSGQTAWKQILWGSENQVIWEAVIRMGAAVTSQTFWAGLKLTNTETIATDADQAYFRFDATDDTNFKAIYSINDVDVSIDTGVLPVINTNYYFRIELDSNRVPLYYIDDKQVGQGTALRDNIDFIPYIGIQDDSASAREIIIALTKISRKIFE